MYLPLGAIVRWTLLLISILSTARPADAQTRGVRLQYGPFVARPYLDERSGELFEKVGRLRAGPGVVVGLGYDIRQVGATAAAEFAGPDIGPPRERDGIPMGRASTILRSLVLLAHWSPERRFGAWRPVLSAGYVRQGIDNVLLRPDQLPPFARDSVQEGSEARPGGIAGSGVRLGLALERVFSGSGLPGRLAFRLEGAGDLIVFTRMTYDGNEQPLPEPGRGFTPRVTAALHWSPSRAPDAAVQ